MLKLKQNILLFSSRKYFVVILSNTLYARMKKNFILKSKLKICRLTIVVSYIYHV